MVYDVVIYRINYAALTDWCQLLRHCVTQEDWWAIHNYLATMQEVLKDFLDEKTYSSKIYQVFGYVLQIMICSLVLFAMIFQTCYGIYMRYKFWCWLQSHLHQDLTKLKLVCWSSSKGEFTQYPFFVRFCPFFYVFASPWKSMRFFIRIFISPYTHQVDCYI